MPKRWVDTHREAWGRAAAVVLGTTMLVAGLRTLLDPWLSEHLPYLIFVLAVAASTRWAGWRAGAAAVLTSVVAGTYLFAVPRYRWRADADSIVEMLTFVVVSAALVGLLETEVRLRHRAQHEHARRLQAERELDSERRLESIGLLAGGVAHDFNNLLTVILGSADLLRAKTPDDPRLNAISLAASQGAELVKQLLRFAQREAVKVASLSLSEAVREGEPLLRRLLPADIALILNLDSVSWQMSADPVELQQVLLNLVTNARDAMPRGGTLSIRTDDVTLDAEFSKEHPDITPGEYVHLGLSDTGRGLTEEEQKHIFEPFFSTKQRGHGTGLGLAVVHGIVKQAHGHICVSSQPGMGTTFDLYWPRAADGPSTVAQPVAREEPVAPLSRPLRVLLVDDEEAVLEVTEAMISRMGHEVIAQTGPAAALKVLSNSKARIDVLVTDVVMPWMNGKELAEQVVQLRPGTPVIFMSGYSDDALSDRGVIGADTLLLHKPFSAQDLEAVLRTVGQGTQRARTTDPNERIR